jgi:hypothetical protein
MGEALPRAAPLHSGHNAAESSHRQSEDVIFINHCDMIVPVGIPLFCLLLFCMCKYDTYQPNHVDTCIILPWLYTYIFFQEINHCGIYCVHWCSAYDNKDLPHVPKHVWHWVDCKRQCIDTQLLQLKVLKSKPIGNTLLVLYNIIQEDWVNGCWRKKVVMN